MELRGGLQVPARLLPLARLIEVVIHHVDLDIGYEIHDIEQTDRRMAAGVVRVPAPQPRRIPAARPDIRLRASASRSAAPGEPIAVSGTSANLLGWLTCRVDASAVRGDVGLNCPSF